jgi:hypothetical protein
MKRVSFVLLVTFVLLTGCASVQDPLPSWNEGVAKEAIITFIEKTTTPGGADFVLEEERVAVFDNDGTLWAEQPMYFQLAFVLDRLEQLAPEHPEWKTTQPFKAAMENDMKTLHDYGEKGLIELLMATHAGMTTDEFEQIAKDWLSVYGSISAADPSPHSVTPMVIFKCWSGPLLNRDQV